MKKTATRNEPASYPSQETISQRARELWEHYGRPDGRDNEIWLEAERQLLGVDSQVEGSGNTSVSAEQFDESTGAGKPTTRLVKSSSAPKSATSAKTSSSTKTSAAAKAGSSIKTAASDKPSLARSRR